MHVIGCICIDDISSNKYWVLNGTSSEAAAPCVISFSKIQIRENRQDIELTVVFLTCFSSCYEFIRLKSLLRSDSVTLSLSWNVHSNDRLMTSRYSFRTSERLQWWTTRYRPRPTSYLLLLFWTVSYCWSFISAVRSGMSARIDTSFFWRLFKI